MKKLFLVTHKMSGGGCERVIAQLLERFSADGVDCTLISECAVSSFYSLPDCVGHVYLGRGETLRSSEIPRAYLRLRRLVRRERPDVVLAMPEKVNVWTVLALLGTGVPVVVSERNDPHRHPESRVKRLLRRLAYPFAAGFIFQTEEAAAYFGTRIRARGVVLDNPLDGARIPAPYEGPRKKVITAAGRLHPQKNFAMLLRAFARFYRVHHDYSLVIYGEGEQREKLAGLASRLGVAGAVELPGQTKTLPEDISDCAIFALSSDYEGMPNALIEAMACGLCCIATDCPIGGVASLIRDGENGLLVPAGDEDALLAALLAAADDPALAERLGKSAERIKTRLDATRVAAEWRRYLERVAKG